MLAAAAHLLTQSSEDDDLPSDLEDTWDDLPPIPDRADTTQQLRLL